MTYTTDYVPDLMRVLRRCIDALKAGPQIDINAYIVMERETVEAGEELLAKIESEIGTGYLTEVDPEEIDDEKSDLA